MAEDSKRDMRICILTQPLGINYGGTLQAFALQKVLKDMGHSVTTLRWIPPKAHDYKKMARRFLSKYLKGNKDIVYFDYNKQIHFTFREMDRFINEHIQCLEARAPLQKNSIPGFDAYIVGSDQVWRPMYSPFLPNFYLDFLADADVKRIAYAASFGVDTWETDEETTRIIRPLARQFDSISVREESAIDLCNNNLGVCSQLMPDPTLLLSSSDYLSLCAKQPSTQFEYIAAYILDQTEKVQCFLNRISRETGLPIRNIGQIDWVNGVDSIEQWIKSIAGAKYVVTDSFHGTVFSLLFERNFVTISNNMRGTSRFDTILGYTNLHDRLIDKDQLDDSAVFNFDVIDYTPIRVVLKSLRQKGLSFLNNI